MIIYGKPIAEKINSTLLKKISSLKQNNTIPKLAIILIGDNPQSHIYVKEKVKKAAHLGILTKVITYNSDTKIATILTKISELNTNKDIHGIIVQLPLPKGFDANLITGAVSDKKDVDGFKENSRFSSPIAIAVIEILKTIAKIEKISFKEFILKKSFCILGKGKTAGEPIAAKLKKLKVHISVIDSKTKNSNSITRTADVIISCVGKPKIVTTNKIKKGVILISAGITKTDGKIMGDYDEQDINSKAAYYTPTPRGIGPVNVTCLLQNVVTAAALY